MNSKASFENSRFSHVCACIGSGHNSFGCKNTSVRKNKETGDWFFGNKSIKNLQKRIAILRIAQNFWLN